MGLKQDLMAALKEAMQNKDTLKKETITMLRAAILQVEKDTLKELSEAEMGTIVAKEVKKRKESIADFEKGGRQDIVDQLNKEIEILSVYMPAQLSEEEIVKMVVEAIAAVGATLSATNVIHTVASMASTNLNFFFFAIKYSFI